MEIKKIGLVGFGITGSGIAQICALSNYQVEVVEINQLSINKGLNRINLALNKAVENDDISKKDKEAVLDRIQITNSMSDFWDCDLVIEAIVENIDEKKKLFIELDRACPAHTIFVSNTSCLSVTDMAVVTQRPDKVLGLHFFNPVPVMALLEIVRTIVTSDETIRTIEAFGRSIGKTIVMAKDEPGFIVNRILMPFILNAIRMLDGGVASRDDIDKAIQLGLNHPMGPLALADLIGLDIIYSIVSSLYQEFKDPQYTPPITVKKMIAAGWLGRKTGQGFYSYK